MKQFYPINYTKYNVLQARYNFSLIKFWEKSNKINEKEENFLLMKMTRLASRLAISIEVFITQ